MKKLLSLILCGVLVLGVTGCGNNDNDVKDNKDTSNNEQKENITNNEVEKTYYCTEKSDDDWYIYFYYKNDELEKLKIMATKWSGLFEDYSEIKTESMNYDGVSLSKDSDFIYFDVDVKNGGYKYLKYAFSDDLGTIEENSSWDNVSKIMGNEHKCVEK